MIEQLEEQRKQELAARAKAATASGQRPTFNANPVIQQLKIALAEGEANVASLRARVSELEARYAQLRAAARMQPELEAELTQLNRDYEIQKKQYESLVTRRESAAISGSMDATAGVADFRVIDPPIVAPKPVAPNRLLLLAGALAAALAAGVAASLLVSQVFPTVHDVRRLRVAGRAPRPRHRDAARQPGRPSGGGGGAPGSSPAGSPAWSPHTGWRSACWPGKSESDEGTR